MIFPGFWDTSKVDTNCQFCAALAAMMTSFFLGLPASGEIFAPDGLKFGYGKPGMGGKSLDFPVFCFWVGEKNRSQNKQRLNCDKMYLDLFSW